MNCSAPSPGKISTASPDALRHSVEVLMAQGFDEEDDPLPESSRLFVEDVFETDETDAHVWEFCEGWYRHLEEMQVPTEKHMGPELVLGELVRFVESIGADPSEPLAFRALIESEEDKQAWEDRKGAYRTGAIPFESLTLLPDEGDRKDRIQGLLKLFVANVGRHPGDPYRGIYMTIAKTDGEGVGSKNVVAPRSYFVDDDQNELDLVGVAERLPPSAIVQSKGGAHVHWECDDDLELWELPVYQKSLARALGTDASVHDAARIMRVPGFLHTKARSDLFPVRLIYSTEESLAYAKEDLEEAFDLNIDGLEIELTKATFNASFEPGSKPTEKMLQDESRVPKFLNALRYVKGSTPGGNGEEGRHHATYIAAATAHDWGLSQEEAWPHLQEWNKRCNEPPLKDREVHHQLVSAYRYCQKSFGHKLVESDTSWLQQVLDSYDVAERRKAEARGENPERGSLVALPNGRKLDGPVRFFTLKPGEYLSEQLPTHTPDDKPVLRILCTPHGTGKTTFAKREMGNFRTGIAIANTTALVTNLASTLGIACYVDDKDAEKVNKVATTVNSLISIDDPREGYEVVLVDETDQDMNYLHSGKVRSALSVNDKIWACVASAKLAILASADMTPDYVELACLETWRRNPEMQVEVYYQPPVEGRREIRYVPTTLGKALIEQEVKNHRKGGPPLIILATGREWVPKAARLVQEFRPDLRVDWVSSENSRIDKVQDTLRDPDSILRANDVLVLSPAVQSGVDFKETVRKVIVYHTARNVPAESVAQMIMRARNVIDTEVIYSINRFSMEDLACSDEFLLSAATRTADRTRDKIFLSLPEYKVDFERGNQPMDELFTRGWCIAERRTRLSYNDPLGRSKEVALRHGWIVNDYEMRVESEDSDFAKGGAKRINETFKACSLVYDAEREASIVQAEKLDEIEAREVERKVRLTEEEQNSLRRYQIEKYFGRDADEELVHLDNKGKFRKRCRSFNRMALCEEAQRGKERSGRELAMLDYYASRGKQQTEYTHHGLKAQLMLELFTAVFGGGSFEGEVEMSGTEIGERAWEFYQDYSLQFAELFRSSLKSPEKASRWALSHMRSAGAEISSRKSAEHGRIYTLNWDKVREYGAHEREEISLRYREMEGRHGMQQTSELLQKYGDIRHVARHLQAVAG